GWEGQGADAADEAVTSTSSVFTSLADNFYSAGSVIDGFRERIDEILTDIETKEGVLAAVEEDDDDDDDGWSGGIIGGVDQGAIERSRINGDIKALIDEAIAEDYVFGSTISDFFDSVTRSILSLYGAGEMFPTQASGLADILENEEVTPPPDTSCAPHEGDERLTVVGPIPPPWAGAEDDGGGMGFWDWVQGGIDVLGLIPAIGEIADGTNVVISLSRAWLDPENRGEYLADAGFSLGAMIPFIGWGSTAAKWGDNAYDASKVIGLADDIHDIERVVDASEDAMRAASNARFGDLPSGYRIDPDTGRMTAPDGRYLDDMGRWRNPDGTFAKNPLRDPDATDRPYVRNETLDDVRSRQIDENGNLVDSNGDPLDPDWVDLGHRRGFENWRLREKYENGDITWEEWKEIANDPDIYEYQDRSRNRSHQDELPRNEPSEDLDRYIEDRGWED
ncbi:MAG: hypothetical protein GEU79_09695, partial [Acidimicrobiia bacterium]|nr:hypothetical protein [Acidimicrobiia bacterium]